jgi:HEAT repeat protein
LASLRLKPFGSKGPYCSLSLEDLPLLRQLADDQNWDVRARAVTVLASFSQPEDLPLLRQLTKDAQPYVRALAAEALASFSGPEALLLLREWASHPMTESPQRAFEP